MEPGGKGGIARPLVLIVLDGWGINPRREGNAPLLAKTPNLDRLIKLYPSTRLNTSGLSVGLPPGQMGNSEVGHLTMGAGRVIYQELTRIGQSIDRREFFQNPVLRDNIARLKESGGALHLIGLVSDGGVHSHIDHLFALVDMAKREGLKELYIHVFLDGRDTPPRSGRGYVETLKGYLERVQLGSIATISGRYYAMDRDNRWERIEKAYRAMVYGEGRMVEDPLTAVDIAYQAGETDEFVLPTVVDRTGVIKDGDGIIFFNFRADRARELTRAFTQTAFIGFQRNLWPRLTTFVSMTEYDATFSLPIAFPPQSLKNIHGEVLSVRGLKQFRIAETEKYAHVTFFFNGGIERPFDGEERLLVPSPRDVPTYDKRPEMGAYHVTEEAVRRIKGGDYPFILINYANGDMVGHTGVLEAAIKACEAVDECVKRVVEATFQRGGIVIITSDHGNVEQMIDYTTGAPHTAHTTNPVPFILVDDDKRGARLKEGGLADVAPTVLELMGMEKPEEMTGESLLDSLITQ